MKSFISYTECDVCFFNGLYLDSGSLDRQTKSVADIVGSLVTEAITIFGYTLTNLGGVRVGLSQLRSRWHSRTTFTVTS